MCGTLCNYEKAKVSAFVEVNRTLIEYDINQVDFWNDYKKLRPGLLRQVAVGSISRKDCRIQLYAEVLKNKVSKPLKISNELNDLYIKNINSKVELFKDVKPAISKLKEKYINMSILENGYYNELIEKYKTLKLYEYMPLYAGKKIGFEKPNINAYSYVLVDLKLEKSETIMVTDSIKDYNGAINAGLTAILIDRTDKNKSFNGRKIRSMLNLIDLVN